MSPEEYNETKEETLEQLKELNAALSKLKEGNLSLIDEVNSIQLAIQGYLFKIRGLLSKACFIFIFLIKSSCY